MSNRVKLPDIAEMFAAKIAELPLDQLSMLQDDLTEAKAGLKDAGDKIAEAIAIRFAPVVAAERKRKAKDTGSVTVSEGDCKCVADLPKTVEWDQSKLSEAVSALLAMDKNPDDFIGYKYTVSEGKYNNMEPSIKALFTPARTVKPGKPTYKLTAKEA